MCNLRNLGTLVRFTTVSFRKILRVKSLGGYVSSRHYHTFCWSIMHSETFLFNFPQRAPLCDPEIFKWPGRSILPHTRAVPRCLPSTVHIAVHKHIFVVIASEILFFREDFILPKMGVSLSDILVFICNELTSFKICLRKIELDEVGSKLNLFDELPLFLSRHPCPGST